MARRFATRVGAIRVNRFAEKKTIFITFEAIRTLKPAIRKFWPPEVQFAKEGVQFEGGGEP